MGEFDTNDEGLREFFETEMEIVRDLKIKGIETTEFDNSAVASLPLKGEDSWMLNPEQGYYGVFDGLGGQPAGELASKTVADSMYKSIRGLQITPDSDMSEQIRGVFSRAYDALGATLNGGSTRYDNYDKMQMCTTATIAIIRDEELWVGHVGDCRAYVWDGEKVTQLTEDQGQGNVVAGLLGFAYPEMWEKQQVSISHPIKSGDRVLLCSDGITGDFGEDKLSLEEIEYCLKSGSPSDSAEFLTKVARKQDDRTSVVFDVQ